MAEHNARGFACLDQAAPCRRHLPRVLGAGAWEMRALLPRPAGASDVLRYHFHFHDGVLSPDTDGTNLPDQDEAEREAARLAGEMLKHGTDEFRRSGEWRVEVTDHEGVALLTLCMSLRRALPPGRVR